MDCKEEGCLTVIALAVFMISFMVFTSCGIIKGHSNPLVNKGIDIVNEMIDEDGPVEEMIEDKIETYTGLILDLSPASEER